MPNQKKPKRDDPQQPSLFSYTSHNEVQPLFAAGRDRVNISELAAALQMRPERLRMWAMRGLIPGAYRPAKGFHWEFECRLVEQWWNGRYSR